MIEQAKAKGLLVRTQMVNHVVRGLPRANARQYAKPDPAGELHVSLTKAWRLLEYFPKAARYRDWPKRKIFLRRYFPRAEPRFIPDGSLIHSSVVARMKRVPGYRPVNLPPEPRNVEP